MGGDKNNNDFQVLSSKTLTHTTQTHTPPTEYTYMHYIKRKKSAYNNNKYKLVKIHLKYIKGNVQTQGWGTGTHKGYYAKKILLTLGTYLCLYLISTFNVPQKLFTKKKKKVSDRRTNIPKHLNLLSECFEY